MELVKKTNQQTKKHIIKVKPSSSVLTTPVIAIACIPSGDH